MSTYTRPFIEPLKFRDESGTVIDYGRRWADLEGPPESMYSVVEHPERFAPLHTVAAAVVAHLVENYDVDVEEGYSVLSGHRHAPGAEYVTRAVRLTPRSAFAAPVTLAWTNDPAIRVYAGALFETSSPSCSCEACDERWNECADRLEEQVFSITAGGLPEHVSEPKRPKWSFEWGKGLVQGMGQTISYRLRGLDGESEESGQTRAESVPAEMLESAQITLRAVHLASPTHAWMPWPKKPRRT